MKNFKIFLTLTALLVTSSLSAVTFNVDTTVDAVDAIPGNGVCRTAAGKCSLRAAITEANFNANVDVIVLPVGTFPITILGTSEDLNATGDFDITQALEIRGAGIGATIIDGKGKDRLFDSVAGKNLTIKDLTIKNGNLLGADNGGGLRYQGSATQLLIQNVEFYKNSADQGGGAFITGDAKVTISDSIIASNAAMSVGSGLTIVVAAMPVSLSGLEVANNFSLAAATAIQATSTGTFTLENSEFDSNDGGITAADLIVSGPSTITYRNNNHANGVGSSALMLGTNVNVENVNVSNYVCGIGASGTTLFQAVNDLTINNLNVEDNLCMMISAMQAVAGNNINITNSKFNNNAQTFAGIGPVYMTAPNIMATGVEISNNTGKGQVAGAYIGATNTANLSKVSVTNNLGQPALAGLLVSGLTASVIDSTIQNNSVLSGFVGGLYLAGDNINLERSSILNNSCSGNTCQSGNVFVSAGVLGKVQNTTIAGGLSGNLVGGLHAAGNFEIYNTTITNNGGGTLASGIVVSGTTKVFNTIIADNFDLPNCAGNPLVANNNNILGAACNAGATDQVVDPKLLPLADLGAGIIAAGLDLGSPAIDKGKNTTCLALDQRKLARPFDGDQNGSAICDVGAIESNDFCPADPAKTSAGICGCGVADVDANANGMTDCIKNQELEFLLTGLRENVAKLKRITDDSSAKKRKKIKQVKNAVSAGLTTALDFGNANAAGISVAGADPLSSLLSQLDTSVRKSRKVKSLKFNKLKKDALKNIDKFKDAI